MKRLLILCFVLLLSLNQLFAQTSRWLWESSGTGPNTSGSDGTAIPNVPARNYVPASRSDAATAADSAGNLWLYGGHYYLTSLWRYNTATSEWTLLTGSSSDPAPSYKNSASSWIDKDGNFWLFGGLNGDPGYAFPQYDLWKFDIAANKWVQVRTQVIGEQGVYGTQGVPSPNNHPGGRYNCVSWREGDNLWLYGGYGFSYKTQSYSTRNLNDVWRYNITTDQWTWMAGDIYAIGPDNSYGMKGVPSQSNFPGSRSGAAFRTDKNGTLWMYGGAATRYGENYGSGNPNDLWKYDIATYIWTWMAGDTTISSKFDIVYGTKGVAAEANTPGSRLGACSFTDTSSNFWLFGGSVNHNDLWKFDIDTNQWTWVDGDSTANVLRVYGTDGVSNPGGRQDMAAWTDNKGQFWMFGGSYQDNGNLVTLNDLWTYTSTQALPVTLLSFTGVISGKTAVLNWATAQAVNSKGFEVQKSKDGRTYSNSGFVDSKGYGRYSFTDNSLLSGTSLYRLKMVDVNGSFAYSPIINLDYSSFNWSVMNTSSSSYVQLQLDKPSSVSIQVLSMNGTIIQSVNKGLLEAGSYTTPLNMRGTSSGLYIVKLTVNEKSYAKKIMNSR